MNIRTLFLTITLSSLCIFSQGCEKQSYPKAELVKSLMRICEQEYGIKEVRVKILDNTVGVYLPLKQLFAADFNESVVQGKVRNLETLFEPTADALEKVEDVLFSISRVLLSTDESLKFYVLQATDVENTGLQLVLTGYADDVKRVRVWDISRDEYRKRLIHEMRQNRAVMWHKPVRDFFRFLEQFDVTSVRERYFGKSMNDQAIQNLFFNALYPEGETFSDTVWEIEDMRSASLERGEVLVYVKTRPRKNGVYLLGDKGLAQYLFLVDFRGEDPGITRIIPFQYLNEYGQMEEILQEELSVQQNIDEWKEEFELEPVKLGDFLAKQLIRRIQMIYSLDERIQNTFRTIKLNLNFIDDGTAKPYFELQIEKLLLRDLQLNREKSLVYDEDVLYLLNLVSREIVNVLRSYQFGDYDHILLTLDQEAGQWLIGKDSLELFRRKKIDFQSLLSLT